jgi:hypothetical protein
MIGRTGAVLKTVSPHPSGKVCRAARLNPARGGPGQTAWHSHPWRAQEVAYFWPYQEGRSAMASTVKDQAQPEAGHEDRIDPGGCPSSGPAPAAPGGENVKDVRQSVEELQERVHDLERRGSSPPAGAPAAVYSDPDHVPSAVNLQDILPRIKDLAQCVGGMKELAQIVATLAQSKE